MTTQPEAKCRICHLTRENHNVRHPFDDGTSDVKLPERDVRKKKVDPTTQMAANLAAIVTRLVLTLVRKGWLTEREGEYVLTGKEPHADYADPTTGRVGDVQNQHGETAERGVRDPAAGGSSTPETTGSGTAESEPETS